MRVSHSQVPTRFRKTVLYCHRVDRNTKDDSLQADLKALACALLTTNRADSTSAMCNTPAGPGYTSCLYWLFSSPSSSKMGSSLLLLPIKFHFKSQNSSKQRWTPDSLTTEITPVKGLEILAPWGKKKKEELSSWAWCMLEILATGYREGLKVQGQGLKTGLSR